MPLFRAAPIAAASCVREVGCGGRVLAGLDLEVDATQRSNLPEVLLQALCDDDGHGRFDSWFRWGRVRRYRRVGRRSNRFLIAGGDAGTHGGR